MELGKCTVTSLIAAYRSSNAEILKRYLAARLLDLPPEVTRQRHMMNKSSTKAQS